MTSLFERLDSEEAIMRGELSMLREKIATAEERPAHLTITRETLRSLVCEDHSADDTDPQPQEHGPADGETPADAPSSEAPAHGVSDSSGTPGSSGPLELTVARERMLVLPAGAGRAVKVQDRRNRPATGRRLPG